MKAVQQDTGKSPKEVVLQEKFAAFIERIVEQKGMSVEKAAAVNAAVMNALAEHNMNAISQEMQSLIKRSDDSPRLGLHSN